MDVPAPSVPTWLVGPEGALVEPAAKAALMYATALIGLRLAHRRTLAQWTAIDFAAAVAVGAIIGRTAVAEGQSYAVGAVALGTILAAHAVANAARTNRWVAKLVDHRVRVLVHHGRIRTDQLRICGVTEHDLVAQLRERGVRDLAGLRYVLYETKGNLTIVPEADGPDGPLVQRGLGAAAGFPPRAPGAGSGGDGHVDDAAP